MKRDDRQVPEPYLRLRDEIINGSLPPGSVVLETTVSSRFGIGRAAVREAILMLVHDGLLQRGPRGTEVRIRSADEVYEIYQARILLEVQAVETAAGHLSPLDLSRLLHAQEQTAVAANPVEIRFWHRRWHSSLARAARNRTIVEILGRLALQLAPYDAMSLTEPHNVEATEAEHRRILDAVRAGDTSTARQELVAHLERTRDLRITALLSREHGETPGAAIRSELTS